MSDDSNKDLTALLLATAAKERGPQLGAPFADGVMRSVRGIPLRHSDQSAFAEICRRFLLVTTPAALAFGIYAAVMTDGGFIPDLDSTVGIMTLVPM